MTIKTYSLAKDGGNNLTANFKVKEFVCKDGSDAVLIDDALPQALQQIRDYFGAALHINSGYRNPAYNKAVGGSTGSQHTQGRAADIYIAGIEPLVLAQYAESLGLGGIGLYSWGVHVDTRQVKSRWKQVGKTLVSIAGFGTVAEQKPQTQTSIVVERKTVYVGGQAKEVRAGLIDGENYVHLRDLAAALGSRVEYDTDDKKIHINI